MQDVIWLLLPEKKHLLSYARQTLPCQYILKNISQIGVIPRIKNAETYRRLSGNISKCIRFKPYRVIATVDNCLLIRVVANSSCQCCPFCSCGSLKRGSMYACVFVNFSNYNMLADTAKDF